MSAIVLFVILFPLGEAATAEPDTMGEVFFRANQAYRDGRFLEAVSGYRKVIENGRENGHLYYNLANAYFRAKDLGRAVLFYERARLLIPRDGDLNFNLRYAHEQTRDAITESQDFLGQIFFWLNGVTLEEVLGVFIVLNIAFWGVLVLRRFMRPEWTYYTFLILLVLWFIGGLSFGAKWYQIETDDRCVVLPEQVAVLAGPEWGDTALFSLHQGAVVHAEREEGGWTLIRLTGKKRGWLDNKAVERIITRKGPFRFKIV